MTGSIDGDAPLDALRALIALRVSDPKARDGYANEAAAQNTCSSALC